MNYHTLKGFDLIENKKITYAMEDYLEMIYRLSIAQPVIRIGELAHALNVKPSSATKMVGNLRELELVLFEKYGYIKLTLRGKALGEYYIHRHDIINKFLCRLNNSYDETEQTEKIEHYINEKTVANIEELLKKH